MNIIKKTYKTFVNPIIHMIAIMFASLDTAMSKLPAVGSVIPKGTILEYFDLGSGIQFRIWKVAIVYEALVAGTAMKVKKGHLFNVGDTIYVGASLTVAGLDQSNADYDVITLSASASVTIDDAVYIRTNPQTTDDSLFAFTNEETEIVEGQTTLSLQMFHGIIDLYKLNALYNNAGGTNITIVDRDTVIVVPFYV